MAPASCSLCFAGTFDFRRSRGPPLRCLQPIVDRLPTAAEGLVQQHERERRVGCALCKLVLHLEQAALGIEH